MRLPRVRLTLRAALVLNAVAGVALWWLFIVRPAQFRAIAAYHWARWEEETTRRQEQEGSRMLWIASTTPIGEWHEIMARKYERAASRPWKLVGPDFARPLPGQVLVWDWDDFDGTEDSPEPHFAYPRARSLRP